MSGAATGFRGVLCAAYGSTWTTGSGEGIPLVLCNGIGANLELLEAVSDTLADPASRSSGSTSRDGRLAGDLAARSVAMLALSSAADAAAWAVLGPCGNRR